MKETYKCVEHRVLLECVRDNNNNLVYAKTEAFKYHYDTRQRRDEHLAEMLKHSYECSGKVRDNIGTITNPVYVFCNEFYRREGVCESNYNTLSSRLSSLYNNN